MIHADTKGKPTPKPDPADYLNTINLRSCTINEIKKHVPCSNDCFLNVGHEGGHMKKAVQAFIGLKFLKVQRIKRKNISRVCTVVDKHTTTNNAGEIVKVSWVTEHEFCGQIVTNYDVNSVTIARAEKVL